MIQMYLEAVEDVEKANRAAATFFNDPLDVFETSADVAAAHRDAVESVFQ